MPVFRSVDSVVSSLYMTQAYEVKRVEAQSLLSDLKRFAFTRSPGLRVNEQCGYEENKAFYHDDPIPYELREKMGREMCKSSFGFSAFRTGHVRHKRAFDFVLSASIERTIPSLDQRRLDLIPPDVIETYDGFTELEEGALTEGSVVEFSINSHDFREIEVNQTYDLSYDGEAIYECSTEDVLYGFAGVMADIDPDESDDHSDQLYVPEPITRESLSAADNVITNIGFWALVEPFAIEFDQGVGFRSAAAQVRAIMHALATGEVM